MKTEKGGKDSLDLSKGKKQKKIKPAATLKLTNYHTSSRARNSSLRNPLKTTTSCCFTLVLFRLNKQDVTVN